MNRSIAPDTINKTDINVKAIVEVGPPGCANGGIVVIVALGVVNIIGGAVVTSGVGVAVAVTVGDKSIVGVTDIVGVALGVADCEI